MAELTLTQRIERAVRKRRQAAATHRQTERLNVPAGARKPWRNLKDKLRGIVHEWKRRINDLRAQRQDRQDQINTTPGDPHWAGCEDILLNEVIPFVFDQTGVRRNSGKRTETFGNPDSDHHTSQIYASAADFPLVEAYDLARKVKVLLTGDPNARHVEYENFYFTRNGVRYRCQNIAGTHGTGPHYHCGLRRA